MLITKEVEVLLHGNNIKWYKDKGYYIPRYNNNGKLYIKKGTKIKVKVEDLPHGSEEKVDIQCDNCKNILANRLYKKYKQYVQNDGKYYCCRCAIKISKEINKKIPQNSISFYDWCYKHLSQEQANKIISMWDNNKNKSTPKEVSYGSTGKSGKGYWFKCLEHPEHEPELKNINSFTKDIMKGNKFEINCHQCNKIIYTHPELVDYFVNKNDTYIYSVGAKETKEILLKCPTCGFIKKMSLRNLIGDGFGCPRCSDGISYPEKFMFNLLEQLNIEFHYQLSKIKFDWCGTYKYDYYIEKINSIIELHGIQHYKEFNGKAFGELENIQNNDSIKKQIAEDNYISNYIIIDCRYSKLDWIKHNIMISKLPKLLKFNESDINWLDCHKAGFNSLVKEACKLWNEGICNTLKISLKLKIHQTTVIKYLKRGKEIGWCNYIPQKFKRKVICLTTNKIFDSVKEAAQIYNMESTSIVACCKGKLQTSGKLSDGTKLKWMYYNDYINNN